MRDLLTLDCRSMRPAHDHSIPAPLARALPGRFIVFDGPDGSGKSTQLHRFIAACRAADLHPVEVREPGGTEVGERIRRALLDHLEREEMSLRCEMLLYMASRAQLCEQIIAPALAADKFVLADRFVSSTLAYQGTAGGLPIDEIHAAARIATQTITPDAVVIFDVDQHTAAARMNPLLRGGNLDRMEAKGTPFHRKVRQGYLDQATRDPDHHIVIDATADEDTIYTQLIKALQTKFAK